MTADRERGGHICHAYGIILGRHGDAASSGRTIYCPVIVSVIGRYRVRKTTFSNGVTQPFDVRAPSDDEISGPLTGVQGASRAQVFLSVYFVLTRSRAKDNTSRYHVI